MSKFFTPLLLIAISVGLFFFFIDPTNNRIKTSKAEQAQYDVLLNQAKELKKIRDELLDEYNKLDPTSKERLTKMMPDNVDNIRLLIELDSIASKYGMVIRDIALPGQEESQTNGLAGETVADQVSDLGTIQLQFSVASSYANFLAFVEDLEQNLRLVDLERIAFETSEIDFNEYKITLKTYWLKSSAY